MGCRRQSEGRCMSGLALELWFVVGQGPGVEPRCTVSRELTSRSPGCNLTPERAISWLAFRGRLWCPSLSRPSSSSHTGPFISPSSQPAGRHRREKRRIALQDTIRSARIRGSNWPAVWRASTNRVGRFQ